MELGAVGRELLLITVACIPIGLSLWAILDIARQPAWAWSLAGRNRTAWMAAVLIGILFLVLGLVVASYYLVRVRPQIAAAEQGRF
ncbi:MAG: DUF2516 family protein [Acidimicrobiia bacterium]|nr:DUF2516 family protein [Acidimicrobiia bacterium]